MAIAISVCLIMPGATSGVRFLTFMRLRLKLTSMAGKLYIAVAVGSYMHGQSLLLEYVARSWCPIISSRRAAHFSPTVCLRGAALIVQLASTAFIALLTVSRWR
jgi:hypothetical protein